MEIVLEANIGVDDVEGFICTCHLKRYEAHTCPYAEEINNSLEECSCCPYCEAQCALDI